MATVRAFRALRPRPEEAARVAAVPYDVIDVNEARALADGNPLSFLRVSRAELELPPGTDPYAEAVYERARANFATLSDAALEIEGEPRLYVYRLRMGAHVQTGLAGCFSIDEYDRDVIKKHERTRRDKEDDRTRHMTALGAQTGPVFLTYKSDAAVESLTARVMTEAPLYDFEAPDGVQHTVWRADASASAGFSGAFERIPALYIADGHHRAASAARTWAAMRERGARGTRNGDAGPDTMLAVAFPHDQVQVLPYNRVVKDLAGQSPDALVGRVREHFTIAPGPATPTERGAIAMYLGGQWQTLRAHPGHDGADPVARLDVSVLQDRLLSPVLGIGDPRTDKRIDSVGGARGTAELERVVDSGRAAVAFSLFPVRVDDLMHVSDAGGMMPPKSTWFEPKLRDGLLIHVI